MINSDAGRIANGKEYLGQRRSEEAVDEEVNHSRTLPIVAATITLVRRGPATAVPGAGFRPFVRLPASSSVHSVAMGVCRQAARPLCLRPASARPDEKTSKAR